MSKIWSMMDVGKRSLMNSQTGLQTVSHNIANKSTEGYSRQRVETMTNQPTGHGRLRMGMGARAVSVTRTNNPYLEKQLENEGSNLGTVQAKSQALARVEQVFNEQINKGLNKFMTDFFNSFRELSNNPESLSARTLVKETADFLAKGFGRVDRQLDQIQEDVDYQITTLVGEINELTKEIASLNEKIQVVELNGVPANDERDRRDLLIKNLASKVNIRYTEGKDSQVTITAGDTALLVSGYSSRDLIAKPTPAREGKGEGNIEIFYKPTESGTPVQVTQQFKGGELGGLLEARDVVINDLRGKTDQMAYRLATNINNIHVRGFDKYDGQGGTFFKQPDSVKGAAQTMKVSEDILQDVGKIAVAARPGSPGDNRVANVISSLQYQKTMGNGEATYDDYYASMVGEIGVQAARANSSLESQDSILKQLNKIRESISGVSLDEETTKLIEYQKQFDASARLIRTADEMLDTVLNIKRY